MTPLFADTFYWAALLNPRDTWHQSIKEFNRSLFNRQLVTTDEVLLEFLNFFSTFSSTMRQGAAQRVQDILLNPQVQVIPQTHDSLLIGLTLYTQRSDKEYSLTDCISMQTMRRFALTVNSGNSAAPIPESLTRI